MLRATNLVLLMATLLKKREQIYVEKVNTIVCDEILGSPGNRAQWEAPLEKEKGVKTR